MSRRDSRRTLSAEKDALGVYLESLLQVRGEEEAAPAPALENAPEPTQGMAEARQTPAPEAEAAPAPAPAMEAETPNLPAVIPSETESDPWEGMPEWGEQPFQALLFNLSGLTMAIPLAELSGVLEWPESITALPNHSPWYLGLVHHLGQNVPVIELAQLVVPERIRERYQPDECQQRRIILIDDGRYGLACDGVDEVITLEPDNVRWRTSRTKRKWLAGTVIERKCALLDACGLAHLLVHGQEEAAG
ncbi:purine-binding chemotaxis protein CheW [Thiohalospira halophila DSM 15071]|uniref:Purine-binding chemotaxis protein CheW n=1 Tax=Thiohalospira halophila DSM 15071 TaxID=1123397 RepID=A0A1I1PF44_9GAMM|nr:chemotaxis protein CheW [Thiohalospira halophila]SFD08375.1 purine-binding chemotaxis protein CheW [Thiohalospira halophila DSM 15071]